MEVMEGSPVFAIGMLCVQTGRNRDRDGTLELWNLPEFHGNTTEQKCGLALVQVT